MAILKVPEVPRFATFIVDTIVDVADGTVYKVVSVLADGFDCPRTLYVVAIAYAPIKRKGDNESPPPEPAGPVGPVAPVGPTCPAALISTHWPLVPSE